MLYYISEILSKIHYLSLFISLICFIGIITITNCFTTKPSDCKFFKLVVVSLFVSITLWIVTPSNLKHNIEMQQLQNQRLEIINKSRGYINE